MADDPVTQPPPDAGDEFRARLRQLGYLDNPLDKFFIGGAHGRSGVLLANLKIALKVGLLGGVFLGVVTALGLAALTPETYGAFSAAATLALYFSLVFTALFTALELAICFAVSILGRFFRRLFTRTQMIALYSGVFAALVTVVYGTLWWWADAVEGQVLSRRSLAVLAVILFLAVVLAVLTRRAVTALLALLGGADLAARGKGRATRLYLVVLIAGVVVFAGFRLATTRTPPRVPSPYEQVPSQLSVTLIAVDGGSYRDFAHLTGIGQSILIVDGLQRTCPNLEDLAYKGFFAPLAAPDIHVNPAVWTTVATGVTPLKHGVTSYSGQEIAGLGLYLKDQVGFGLYDALLTALPAVGLSRRAPLERRSLTYPAVWDIIAGKGELSGVVNWWGTWPADDFHGFLVTDRMYPKLQVAKATSAVPVFEEEAYPRALFDRLTAYPLYGSYRPLQNPYAATDIDQFAVTAALEGAVGYTRIPFTAVYLPGLDILENAVYADPYAFAGLDSAASAVSGVTSYWSLLDKIVAPLTSRAGPDHVVIVVCDPGMLKGQERSGGRRDKLGFVIIAGGPAVSWSAALGLFPDSDLVSLVDIAPMVLYLLGFPVSREMDGRVPVEAFTREFVEAHPVRNVETFGRLAVKSCVGPRGRYSVDSELVDRLRSLGYLQ